MQEFLNLTADAAESTIRQRMQETLYQTADAGVFHQTAYAGVSPSDIGCRTLFRTADAGSSLSDSGCRSTLYQTADAGVSLSDS